MEDLPGGGGDDRPPRPKGPKRSMFGADVEERPAATRQQVVIVGVDMPFWAWVNVLATASLAWLVAMLMGAVLLGLVGVAVFGVSGILGSVAERRAADRAYKVTPLTPEE